MFVNLSFLKHKGLRLLGVRKTYKNLCDKEWIISPSEKFISRPAICLDGELEKVKENSKDFARSLRDLQGGPSEHLPTIAYQLSNIQIFNGYVYKGAMKYPCTTARESLLDFSRTESFPEAALTCTLTSNRYFCHWMTDALPLTLAAQQLAEAITTSQKMTDHQIEYSHILNIYSTSVRKAWIKKLILIEDKGQNKYKRERYNCIRSILRALSSDRIEKESEGVMLLRGSSGVSRLLVNELEIAEYLSSQGFDIIDPQKTSARELATRTLGAKVIAGVEGSQLAHGLFTMKEGGVILTFQPPNRFISLYKGYTDGLGLQFGYIVGNQVSNGFEISLDHLKMTLEKVFAALR